MKRPWVVKAGGEVFRGGSRSGGQFVRGLAIASRRRPIVLVHGGGPQLDEALAPLGPRFLRGRRVTGSVAMRTVEGILSGEINKDIVGRLLRLGCPAVGVSGRDGALVRAGRARGLRSAGHPRMVNRRLLRLLLEGGYLPVVSPVSSGPQWEAVNVNADEAASALAVAFRASKLFFFTDTSGVRNGRGRVVRCLNSRRARDMMERNVIKNGMLPKVEASLFALAGGVEEVFIRKASSGFSGFSRGTTLRA